MYNCNRFIFCFSRTEHILHNVTGSCGEAAHPLQGSGGEVTIFLPLGKCGMGEAITVICFTVLSRHSPQVHKIHTTCFLYTDFQPLQNMPRTFIIWPFSNDCIPAKQTWHLFIINIKTITFHDYVTFYSSFFLG